MTYQDLDLEWEKSEGLICHTSGSTGVPKVIKIDKKHLLESARRTAEFFNLSASSLLYSCISPDFVGGKMMFVRKKFLECRLIYESPSNQLRLDTGGKKISLLSVVPSQMIYLLDNIHSLPPIDNILIGGSAIPVSLRKRIAESGLNVYESYGMTETASHIALRKVNSEPSPFRTLGGITVEDENGCLKIIIPGWQTVLTNDCAQVFDSHSFTISGRKDNIIISGGRKLNPEKIEDKLSEYLDFPFYLTSLPDDKWGQKLIIVAENIAVDDALITKRILDSYECLEGFEKPKEMFIRSGLKRTQSGKILRISPLEF